MGGGLGVNINTGDMMDLMVDLGTNMLDNRGGDNMVAHGVDRGDSMANSNSWGSMDSNSWGSNSVVSIGSNWGNSRGSDLKSGNLNSLDSGNLNSSSGSGDNTGSIGGRDSSKTIASRPAREMRSGDVML